ncbi:MAG: hypothetical protein R6X34_13240 [Chloroflexota bacterium]
MKRFTVGKLSMALALVFVVALPVLLFPPYRPLAVTGPYAISTARYTYTDTQQRAEPYTGPPREAPGQRGFLVSQRGGRWRNVSAGYLFTWWAGAGLALYGPPIFSLGGWLAGIRWLFLPFGGGKSF